MLGRDPLAAFFVVLTFFAPIFVAAAIVLSVDSPSDLRMLTAMFAGVMTSAAFVLLWLGVLRLAAENQKPIVERFPHITDDYLVPTAAYIQCILLAIFAFSGNDLYQSIGMASLILAWFGYVKYGHRKGFDLFLCRRPDGSSFLLLSFRKRDRPMLFSSDKIRYAELFCYLGVTSDR